VIHIGGPGANTASGVATDTNGHVWVAGTVIGDADFGTNVTTSAGQDAFIARFDATNAPVWVRRIGGTNEFDDFALGGGVAVDASGNAHVTGTFFGMVDFGGTNLTSSADGDVFVAKYNSTGALVWVRQASAATGVALAVNASGDVFVTGDALEMADFGGGVTITNQGIFLARYSAAGALTWARGVVEAGGGFGAQNSAHVNGLALDSAGNPHLCGFFTIEADFGPTGSFTTATGSSDSFTAKFDSGGSLTWVKTAGGPDANSEAGALAVDAAGNVFVTGSFTLTNDFTGATLVSSGETDVFMARYDAAGLLRWVRSVSSPDATDAGTAIAGNGSALVVAGTLRGGASFDAIPLLSADATQDGFVAGFLTALPQLDIFRSGTNATLAWPIATKGLELQTTTNLAMATVWTNHPGTVTQSGVSNQVAAPLGETFRAFRLRRP
jgi:hypothetical protein